MYAAWNGYEKVIEILLNCKGININAKDLSGDTALMKAAHCGQKKVADSDRFDTEARLADLFSTSNFNL